MDHTNSLKLRLVAESEAGMENATDLKSQIRKKRVKWTILHPKSQRSRGKQGTRRNKNTLQQECLKELSAVMESSTLSWGLSLLNFSTISVSPGLTGSSPTGSDCRYPFTALHFKKKEGRKKEITQTLCVPCILCNCGLGRNLDCRAA